MAEGSIELVIANVSGKIAILMRGPVSRGSLADCPPDGEWVAVRFRLGTYLPSIPTSALMDHRNLDLPVRGSDRFGFASEVFEIPNFENAEQLVQRLVSAGIVAHDSATDGVLEGDVDWMSRRSVQRHFLRTTGMTISGFRQVEKARHAAALLMDGHSILETVFEAGYFDQAHLTRSMKQLIGVTPGALARERPQLSFSYKTMGS